MRDADLLLTPTHLLVVLTFTKRRAWLRPLVQRFNKAEVALPWLDGRRVAMGFAARSQSPPDVQPVTRESDRLHHSTHNPSGEVDWASRMRETRTYGSYGEGLETDGGSHSAPRQSLTRQPIMRASAGA
jgi:hypothetical protein